MAVKRALLIVAILLWSVANLNLVHLLRMSITERNYEYSHCVENPFVHTIDLFDEDFQEIRNREGIVEDLADINQQFHAAKTFDFFEAERATFYFRKEGFRGGSELLLQTGPHTNPEVVALRGLFVGPGIQELFDIPVDQGSYFTDADYLLPTQSNKISVVMGDAFKSYYQPGDSIDLLVRGEVRVGSVIGFLQKGSNILWFNERLSLDQYVLYPVESFTNPPKNQAEQKYMFVSLLSRNNGLVLPLQDLEQIRQEIDNICQQVQLPAYALSMTYGERIQTANGMFYRSVIYLICFNVLTMFGIFIFFRRKKAVNKQD